MKYTLYAVCIFISGYIIWSVFGGYMVEKYLEIRTGKTLIERHIEKTIQDARTQIAVLQARLATETNPEMRDAIKREISSNEEFILRQDIDLKSVRVHR